MSCGLLLGALTYCMLWYYSMSVLVCTLLPFNRKLVNYVQVFHLHLHAIYDRQIACSRYIGAIFDHVTIRGDSPSN